MNRERKEIDNDASHIAVSSNNADDQKQEHQQQNNGTITDADYRFFVNRGDCHRALEHIELALADYHLALKLKQNDWQVNS